MKHFTYIYLLSVLLLLNSCFSSLSNSSPSPEKEISSPTVFAPKIKLFHQNDSISWVYFSLKSSAILYSKIPEIKRYSSRISAEITLSNEDSREVSESITSTYINAEKKNKRVLQGKIRVRLNNKRKYRIKVLITDENRKTDYEKELVISKSDSVSKNDFLLTNTEGKVLFDRAVKDDTIVVKKRENVTLDAINLFYFPSKSVPTKPPYKVDTTIVTSARYELFEHEFVNNKATIHIANYGRYCLTLSPEIESEKLISFNKFEKDFPKVQLLKNLLEPLKYITTAKEYNHLASIKDNKKLKIEIDKWILTLFAKKKKEAKAFIKNYFLRVEVANFYFTTYKEGWKTDRGAIFIIYGSPNKVKTTESYESWVYVNPRLGSTYFLFKKKPTIFGTDDFLMTRSRAYELSWQRNILKWRKGVPP